MKSISASSLIEYLHSSPTRRNSIIKTAISPPVFLLDRYGVTYRAARRALGLKSIDPLQAALKRITGKTGRNPFHKRRLTNTLESLEGAKHMVQELIATETGFVSPSPVDAFCDISGLAVRVSPTSITFRRNKAGIMEVGVLKMHCSKGFNLGPEAAADFGALLHLYAEEKLNYLGPANVDLCIVLDIYARERFTAPKSFKARRKAILEACQEIADRWDRVASRETAKATATPILEKASY